MPPRSWLALLLTAASTTAMAYDEDACPSQKSAPKRVVFTAQKKSQKERPQLNLLETASSTGKFTALVNAVAASGLIDVLVGHQDYTILAPTDQAFRNLPASDIEALLKVENRAKLKEILTYHVIKGRITAEELAEKSSAITLNGAKVTIASNKKGLAINEATVLQADIRCTNGVIHVIDRVLTPAEPDILTIVERTGSFKTLLAAIKAAGLTDALEADGPFTLFAPSDEAFAKLPKETLKDLLDPHNKQALVDVLKLHVVAKDYEASDLAGLKSVPTLLDGKSLAITTRGDRLKVNGVSVIRADLKAGNGIIHAVDEVLSPGPKAPRLLELAASKGQFKTLIAAVKAAGLADALQSDGPFTLFAPTDAAFARIPKAKLKALLDPHNKQALVDLLKLHVIPGKFKENQLASKGSVGSLLEGKSLTFGGSELKVNGVKLIETDIPAGNGLIHVVDEVLSPNGKRTGVLEVAESKGQFKVLLAALKATGLDEAVEEDGPFTILAPTDAAFAKIPADKLKALLQPSGRGDLAQILKYHVLPGKQKASSLFRAGKAKTILGGKTVEFDFEDGRLTVNQSKFLATDVPAGESLIHVIDSVLIP